MTKLEKLILESKPVTVIFNIAKKIKLPGREQLSLYEIGSFFFKELGNNKLFESCAAVTYNFVMALPPTLLVLFSLIPYLHLQNAQDTILNTLRFVTLDQDLHESLRGVILDFMNNQRGEVLSSGILLTLFFSSNGVMGLLRSFERKHLSVYIEKSELAQRWKAIRLTLFLLFVAILSIVVLILQTQFVDEVLLMIFENVIIVRILSVVVVVMIIFTFISIIYRYGPSLHQRAKFFSPGAIFATISSVVTSAVFFFLANNFIHYNKVYGSIGTLMAFMVWIWLNTLVILIGYDLNVSVLQIIKSRREEGEEEEAT